MKILFIGKNNDRNTEFAADYLKQIFPDTQIILGSRGELFPEELLKWQGDYVFSYLSPWIIPVITLNGAKNGGINWHPGSPEYPGIGCTNFAIYNLAKEFGMTCHFMNPKVDTGKIIEVRRFSVLEHDNVYSITQKCYACILTSFLSIVEIIANKQALPESTETWKRLPYKRKELEALCIITTEMTKEEVERRIKAAQYPNMPGAYIEIHGNKFEFNASR